MNKYYRIPHPGQHKHEPEERPEPGMEWGMDFHDVSTVPADPQAKQQYVVKILDVPL